MHTQTQASCLRPRGAGTFVLKDVSVEATLRGLLSEVEVAQTYENPEQTNVEAVYTFPLPLDAVLLELTVELNGEVLRSRVMPRPEAEHRYEDAIVEGGTALLLSQVQPGLYVANVGNLMAGERAVVRLCYAQLHRWQGDTLRFHLPTTLAPRYGDPAASGLAPQEDPACVLRAGYGLALRLSIEGSLAGARVECPSHEVRIERHEGGLCLSLPQNTAMDRDFVVVVREPGTAAGHGLWATDRDGVVALASFHPHVADLERSEPRCVKLVIDCSGSMSGDSIAQARRAMREVLDLLTPGDSFNITRFGSRHELLFEAPVAATPGNVELAGRLLSHLAADMGGTQMETALAANYACGDRPAVQPDVFLITDGAVTNHDALVGAARRSGHRHFTVGVGSAVSEPLLRRLAESTGGACELVSPGEAMGARILRHFKRMHQPMINESSVCWPTAPTRQHPERLPGIFAGDTVHAFAWLARPPGGAARLAVHVPDARAAGEAVFESVDDGEEPPGTLARLAAHARLATLGREDATALAVEYQLVTQHTSCLLVKERSPGERAADLPQLRPVPHELAAGWGGLSTAVFGSQGPAEGGVDCFDSSEIRTALKAERPIETQRRSLPRSTSRSRDESASTRSGQRYIGRSARGAAAVATALNALAASLQMKVRDGGQTPSLLSVLSTVADLRRLGVSDRVVARLGTLVEGGHAEAAVVLAWLSAFVDAHRGHVARHARRCVRHAAKRIDIPKALREQMTEDLLV